MLFITESNKSLIDGLFDITNEIKIGLAKEIDDSILTMVRTQRSKTWEISVNTEHVVFRYMVNELNKLDDKLHTDGMILETVLTELARDYSNLGIETEVIDLDGKLSLELSLVNGLGEGKGDTKYSKLNYRLLSYEANEVLYRSKAMDVIENLDKTIILCKLMNKDKVEVDVSDPLAVGMIVEHYKYMGFNAHNVDSRVIVNI